MKNIYEILKEYGMEVPADKKADFDKAWKENYRTKSEYDNAVSQRDNYKASLDDVNAKLKEFEGVDVKDLQGQITKLQGDLKAKDDEYAAKEADRVFMDSIKEAVKTAGGRNEKAVIAMLDIDALKESKNQSDDIKKALEDVKKSDGYLFGANEPINNAVGGTNIGGGADPGADDVSAIRAAMGLLKSVGYRLSIRHKREQGIPGYILIEAVPIADYSDEIELSKDCGLNYTMEDKRNGVNHLIVTGKGELKDRNVLHLYVWPNGSFKKAQYYKGLAEITQVYENTSTETDELESQSTKKLQELCSKKIFGMDIAKLGIDVGIGDIVGGRDYLTGMYSSRPVANIIYSVTNRVESKEYELEGESDNGNS